VLTLAKKSFEPFKTKYLRLQSLSHALCFVNQPSKSGLLVSKRTPLESTNAGLLRVAMMNKNTKQEESQKSPIRPKVKIYKFV